MTMAELRKLARSRGFTRVGVGGCTAEASTDSGIRADFVLITAPTRRAAIAGLAAALRELPEVKR